MEFTMTLWYAAAVVSTFSTGGFTIEDCQLLQAQILTDIATVYKFTPEEMKDTMFPTNRWETTCEKDRLPVNKKILGSRTSHKLENVPIG